MRTYWLGVVGNIQRVRSEEAETFWCLPMSAAEGDGVIFYLPRAVNDRYHGVFAEGAVVSAPQERGATGCGGYGTNDKLGPLRHAAVSIRRRFQPSLTTKKDIKADKLLAQATFVRRNFQGTTFLLEESSFKRLLKLCEAKGRQGSPKGPQSERKRMTAVER